MILIFSALLFSLSSNLDNIVVGIAYGIKNIKIGIFPNLLIATITSSGTLISMLLGKFIANFFSTSISNILGAAAIIILGIYFIIKSLTSLNIKRTSNSLATQDIASMVEYAKESDLDNSGDINLKEALIVAFGLIFNNLGTGIAASVTGISIPFTVIFTFIFSILLIILGYSLGNKVLGKILGKYAPLTAGILLILLGVIEMFH